MMTMLDYEFVKKYWPHWKLGHDGERIVFNTYNGLFDSDSIDEFAEETRMRIKQAHYSEEYGLTLSFTKIGDKDKWQSINFVTTNLS